MHHSEMDFFCFFLDLKKAFDTVEHPHLLEKLAKIGLRGKALLWLKSYLEGRSQFVTVNEVTYKLLDVKFGVPRGSILGNLHE